MSGKRGFGLWELNPETASVQGVRGWGGISSPWHLEPPPGSLRH